MNLELIRHAYLPQATLGLLRLNDSLSIATLEEPWRRDPDGAGGQRREGELHESCIPDGRYQIVPHDSQKHGSVYALVNPTLGVYRWPGDIPTAQKWGRSAILIHAGNSTDDILGCIAVGMHHGWSGQKPVTYQSRTALGLLQTLLVRDTTHVMTIRPTTGTLEL